MNLIIEGEEKLQNGIRQIGDEENKKLVNNKIMQIICAPGRN